MKKILVYIYDNMATFEIALLTQLLASVQDMQVIIAADEVRFIKDMPGFSIMPQVDLKSVDIKQLDGMIIPGGWLAHLDEQLIRLIRDLNEEKKLVAAICAAPWILAKAGILEGRKYTTSIAEWTDEARKLFKTEDPFPREGYVNSRVVRDDNIITAQGSAFVDFTIEVIDYFNLFEDEAERKAFEREYKGF